MSGINRSTSTKAPNNTKDPSGRRWAVILPAMVLPLIASLFYFVLFSGHDLAKLLYALTKLFTLVWPLIAVKCVLGGQLLPKPFVPAIHLRALPLGLISGAIVAALMFALMHTALGDMVYTSKTDIEAKVSQLGVLQFYWTFGIFLAIVHSLIEEIYWRWFVYGQLRHLVPVPIAHLAAGIAFAAHHVVIACQYFPMIYGLIAGICVGMGGILWSTLYQRQQSLAGAWLSHIIVDFAILAIGANLLFA